VGYDPDSSCPEINKFLQDIKRRDTDWQTMVEMIGYSSPSLVHTTCLGQLGTGAVKSKPK